jgi:hypothetical protein
MTDTRAYRSLDNQELSAFDMKSKTIEHVESTDGSLTLAEEILNRYPLLVGKSQEELASLNKKVLKKLDWKFLPCITLMLLMK